MLDLAEALNPLLNDRAKRLEDGLEDDEDVADTTLQLVFFDGEEAFKDWTDTDSIYGARYISRFPQNLSPLDGPQDTWQKNGSRHTFGLTKGAGYLAQKRNYQG